MNKGLEVIEAARLYSLEADRIKVVVHPESITHSMVEYIDNAVLASARGSRYAYVYIVCS